jgi:hypothetical protein
MKIRIALLALLTATSACSEDRPLAGPVDPLRDLPEGAVQAMVQQRPGTEPGTVEYTVRVLGRRSDVAAYQGIVTFDVGAMELLQVRTPEAGDGEVHIVNSTTAMEGTIRFAAYAPEKFGTDEAFTMVVRPRMSGVPDITATLDVAGTEAGKALDGTLLRASSGVRDVQGRLLK